MPDEIVIIIVTAISAGTLLALVAMILGSLRSRRKDKQKIQQAKGSNVSTGELKKLMREAVSEGTRDLVERIEDLEDQLEEALARPPELEAARTDLYDELDEPEEAREPIRRRRTRRR